jgi:multidrug resistance efflux pump
MLREQYERRSKLTPGYSIAVENLDNAHRQSESAAASYQQAIASRGHQSMVSSPISILQTAPVPRRASR